MSTFKANYIYYSIMRKDAGSDPERVNLEKGLEASQEKFKALLKKGGPQQKYQMGIMTHASQEQFGFQFPTNFPKEQLSKNLKRNQIEEMLTVYCQKTQSVFTKQVTTEADAGLITLAVMQEKAKDQLEAVKATYKGKGQTLHKTYSFIAYVFDRDAKLVQYAGRWNVNNQKRAIDLAAHRLYNGFFKRFRDYAWLIVNSQKGVVACSEENM
jgi:hypothetical protein